MIPANAICIPIKALTRPRRKQGIGPADRAAIMADQNAEMLRLDAQGEPRWRIAIRMGLSERHVYRRLADLKTLRQAYRRYDEDRA